MRQMTERPTGSRHMRSLSVLIPVLCSCCAVAEKAPEADTVLAESAAERYAERAASLKAWSADFRIVRVDSPFDNPIIISGRLYLMLPDRIRVVRSAPAGCIMATNGDEGVICYPEQGKAREFKLPKEWRPEQVLLPSKRKRNRFVRQFEISLTQRNERIASVRLVPRKKGPVEKVKRVDLVLSRGSWLPELVRIENPKGQYLKIELTNYDIETPITVPFLEYRPPEGTEIERRESTGYLRAFTAVFTGKKGATGDFFAELFEIVTF